MKNNLLKGSLFIALGASSYGMLATFVKMAYHEGFTTAEVTLSQFILGFVILFVLSVFSKKEMTLEPKPSRLKSNMQLLIAGSSMGLTSISYYMAVQYIPVSIGIVLLMQTVWMGVIVEMILHKKMPGGRKIVAVLIVLFGTLLGTNVFEQSFTINWAGFGWGILSALSFTATMYSSNSIALHLPPLKRSLYMVLGGLILIALVFHSSLNREFSYQIFFRWGIVLSLFGTVIPPLLFTRGMPLAGMGPGAIVASVELPVSVLVAHLLLKEPVSFIQWAGVILILFAVVLMNLREKVIIAHV
jgi:drug/metabolite transporter (DMT)-like permease